MVYSIALGASFATQASGRTVFGPQLGADFGAYYIAGKIFNSVSPGRIYDRDLQRKFYHELFPSAPPGEELPYVNAPFFALPFPVLARLEYPLAYLIWILISLGLYVSGFTLLWRTLDAMPEDTYLVALLLALSFMPFLAECLAGGQTSAFGFFFLALAISCERRGRPLMSGAALSLCLYKPTLLLLILPMLVITRRFSTIAGFVIGGLLLAATSLLVVGWQG
ncbi:MAG: glycosyltransferase family 87 protein, partial [Blastocatellia bacterium]